MLTMVRELKRSSKLCTSIKGFDCRIYGADPESTSQVATALVRHLRKERVPNPLSSASDFFLWHWRASGDSRSLSAHLTLQEITRWVKFAKSDRIGKYPKSLFTKMLKGRKLL
jgi:hypothetical protein